MKKLKVFTQLLTSVLCIYYSLSNHTSLAQTPSNDYVLVYRDEFNGDSLNTDEWRYREEGNLVRGGYNRHENVTIDTGDGLLKIAYNQWDVNNDAAIDLVGGGVISKASFGYGYYEARMKFYDETKGFHQSFWNHGNNNINLEDAKNDLIPASNVCLEIDGIELDSDFNHGSVNYHQHQPALPTEGLPKHFSSDYIDTDEWINVGFEWLPGLVIFYIDGVEKMRFQNFFDYYAPQELWLTGLANDELGGVGTPNPGAAMYVDYVRYYVKPVSGNLAPNYSFEQNGVGSQIPYSWITEDGVYNNDYSDDSEVVSDSANAFLGKHYLMHSCQSSTDHMTTKGDIGYISNGYYKLSAHVQSSGGLSVAKMSVWGFDDSMTDSISVTIPDSTAWVHIEIDSILVDNNRALIGFTTIGDDGDWVKVDNVEFTMIGIGDEGASEFLVDKGYDGYTTEGDWETSTITGYQGVRSQYSTDPDAYAQWNPDLPIDGSYDVFIYKIVYPGSDENAIVNVVHSAGTDTTYLNGTTGAQGWVYLGRFPFDSGTSGYVRYTKNGTGTARVDAVKFNFVSHLIDNGDSGYTESGTTWTTSGLTGYNGSNTRVSGPGEIGAYAEWTATLPINGSYKADTYNIPYASNDTNKKVEVTDETGVHTQYLNDSIGSKGWMPLGTFEVEYGEAIQLRQSLNTSGNYLRADAVNFTLIDDVLTNHDEEYTESGSWQTGGFLGCNGGRVRVTDVVGDSAEWTPYIVDPGYYDVYIYKVVSVDGGLANAYITYAGSVDTVTIDFSSGSSDWVFAGRYDFDEGLSGKITLVSADSGVVYANGVRFNKSDLLINETDHSGVQEYGTWSTSSLEGFGETSSKYSNSTGGFMRWWPWVDEAGTFGLYIYKIAHSNSDPNALIEITHEAGVDTVFLDYTEGSSGWVFLGEYDFRSGDYITNYLNTSAKYARADAIYLMDTESPGARKSLKSSEILAKNLHSLIYPNPAHGKLNLDINLEEKGPLKLRILDLAGKSLLTKAFEGESGDNTFSVSVDGLKPGVYVLEIRHKSHRLSSKFIVD